MNVYQVCAKEDEESIETRPGQIDACGILGSKPIVPVEPAVARASVIGVGSGDSTVVKCLITGDITIMDMGNGNSFKGTDGFSNGMSIAEYRNFIVTEILGNNLARLKQLFFFAPSC